MVNMSRDEIRQIILDNSNPLFDGMKVKIMIGEVEFETILDLLTGEKE
jgi:hypothetical protein